jgi:NCS1 family nucleobase:cation symporter-1
MKGAPQQTVNLTRLYSNTMGKFEMPTRQRISAPFQSKATFVNFLRAPQGNEGRPAIGDEKWSNKDLEPTPVEQRTWTWFNLPLYWFSNQFSLVGWNTGSALVTVGLVSFRDTTSQDETT